MTSARAIISVAGRPKTKQASFKVELVENATIFLQNSLKFLFAGLEGALFF